MSNSSIDDLGQHRLSMQDRARLAHGYLGWLGGRYEISLLHVKGPAAHPALGRSGRGGLDADVLVRPRDIPLALEVMQEQGWVVVASFESGSVFEHAATLFHRQWGTVDLHRHFPGIRLAPETAFDVLWRDRDAVLIGGQPCQVPSLLAQRFLLLAHAARSGHADRDPDVAHNWDALADDERSRIAGFARELDAEMVLAAATGALDSFCSDPEYQLWSVFSSGGTVLDGWRARLRSTSGLTAKTRVLWHIVRPNREQLALRLGRVPTSSDVVKYYIERGRGIASETASYRHDDRGRRDWQSRRFRVSRNQLISSAQTMRAKSASWRMWRMLSRLTSYLDSEINRRRKP